MGSEQAWLVLRNQPSAKKWPPIPRDRFFARTFSNTPRTVGELATYLATHSPGTLFDARERWTRAQIEEVVRKLVEYQFGLSRAQYTLDSRFVQDLHID